MRASPAWNAPEGTGSDRATGLTDALDSGFDTMADTLAGPEGDPDAIVEAWLAAADQREAAIAEEDARFDSLMAPVLDALGAGNAAAADTAARLALASVRADDPLVVNAYAALLGAALRHGRRDLAEPWAVRLAEMPPLYLAGLPVDLAPVLSDLAEALSSEGRHANAVTLAEAATVLTPLQGVTWWRHSGCLVRSRRSIAMPGGWPMRPMPLTGHLSGRSKTRLRALPRMS